MDIKLGVLIALGKALDDAGYDNQDADVRIDILSGYDTGDAVQAIIAGGDAFLVTANGSVLV